MPDRTMEELLQAPTEGYGEASVISKILAENFEIKTNLLQLVQANKFHGFERDKPHTYISNFKRMTATLKYRDVPNDAIKLMLFSYSLEGAARVWYVKEPPNSILTWDDLVNKFVNQFFPPSKTTNLKNEISRFTQRFEETFREAWDHFKEILRACPHHRFSELTQIDTFYNDLTEQDQDSLNAASGGYLLNKTTREALKIIKNRSKVRYSRSKSNVSRVNTNSRDVVSKTDDRIDKLADQISNLVEIVNKQVIAPAKAVKKTCVTCGGAHDYYECIATDSNPSSVCTATSSYNQVSPPNRASHKIPPPGLASVQNNPNRGNNFQNNQGYRAQMNNALNFQNQGFQNQPFSVPNNQIPPSVPNEFSSYIKSNEIMVKSIQNQLNVLRNDFNKQEEKLSKFLNDDIRNILSSFFQNQPSTSGNLPSNTIPNPKGEMKAVTARSGFAYEGPSIPTKSSLEKVDERNTEEILDNEHFNNSGSTAQVQPPVVPISISELDVSRTQTKPTILYSSSFADALLLMLKFASTIKSLLANKDKLFELGKVPLNENCSAMLLKKLPEKLGDTKLTPTRMTLELADRSITRPKGVVEDIFVKVRKFHFPTNFVVVDFEADPRVPLILGRSFLRTGRPLIDLYGEEITLRVNDESITFNLNQTMRYSSTYDDTLVNRVDVIDIACEEFVQDVLDFQYNPKSSSPTLVSDDLISKSDARKEPIVKSSSSTLTPFGESDFFLKEIKDFLNDDSIPTGIENSFYDPEGDILFLEELLNEDPFQLPPVDLKLAEESKEKYFVEEPPDLELKELPSHLDSYKCFKVSQIGIAWKISDIKGIDPRFYTHKILMEDDYKPAVQSQRRVNPKIHDVIKKEALNSLMPDISKFLLIHKTRKKLLSHALMEPLRTDACPLACVMLQEFNITILDKKGSENLAADHLSRLKNPHQDVLENKDINENFPLKTLGSLTSHNTPWFADITNFHAGNFIKKGLTSQQKKKFFKDLLTSSKLAMRDLLGAIMVQISQRRRQGKISQRDEMPQNKRTKKLHDSKIKNRIFNVGDQVLIFNSRLNIFFGRLKTRWSGPFTITRIFSYGTIELSQPNGPNFKVNGHCVKHYIGGDIPSNVALDLYTLPMDN
nr:hypothetical protein [Tanacetum cinerariifolium]